PHVGKPAEAVARERMSDWMARYPQVASRHRDADGCVPAHSFFYPWDEYDGWEFERLTELCAAGFGELDLHLHHESDTSETLRAKLREALELYQRREALPRWPDGRTAFGFIHGNWALDNSRCEDGRNYCGVNDELTLLAEAGCYADFTFPAWQQSAQPRQVNSIFYAVDDPAAPKSYDRGKPARAGVRGEGLLLVHGPLVPYFAHARRPRPAMDDGDLASYRRYSPERLDRWVRAGIHVEGRPDWIFIKLHCHGAADDNRHALLGEDFEALFSDAEARYNDGHRYRLHYVTAREMFNVVRFIEAGSASDPASARRFLLQRPTYSTALRAAVTSAAPAE
ncbi:MAG TPA: hypothetical protein VFU47_03430, partial [Armatimonadota bacterium]|nr:hypothetical protein [Armatimonadota bacterium]